MDQTVICPKCWEVIDLDKIAKKREFDELTDFIATVEGYSKFLENTIEINKDADAALNDLKNQLK